MGHGIDDGLQWQLDVLESAHVEERWPPFTTARRAYGWMLEEHSEPIFLFAMAPLNCDLEDVAKRLHQVGAL